MKKALSLLVTLIGSITLACPIYGADKATKLSVTSQPQSIQKIIDMRIFDRQGNEIGEIEDIRINPRNGQIYYVIVSKSITSSPGDDKDVAVPLEILSFLQDKVVLTVDQNKLDGAPRPEKLVSDDKFQRDLQSYYGIAYSWPRYSDDYQNTISKNRIDQVGGNIKSDINGDKIQKQESPEQMDPDASDLKNEFRKLLLIYNPW
jgi:sporulation protein YlmC with PRC-barrel domain